MGKVIFGINLSIDGCCDHTKMTGGDDVHDYFTKLIQDGDMLVYGRKTYELMVPFWPDWAKTHSGEAGATNDFARVFDSKPKIVFSRSLTSVEDSNTTLLHGNLEEEIQKLKQQGKNIMLGGVDLPSQLIALGLVDEYRIMIQPVLVGEGRRLFDDMRLQEALQMKLAESKVFESGAVALRYVKG